MEDVVQWSVGAGFVSLFDTNRQDMHGNILNLVPCVPPSARLQGVVVQHKAPRKGQNEFFQNMSIEIHIPYGGIQKRKTETVHKTELQDKGNQGGWGGGERGMEDGLIGSWLDFFTSLTVVLCHI